MFEKTRDGYRIYLQSEHWSKLRRQVLQRDGRCTQCGSKQRLQPHHKFYRARWEDSQPEDLVTLCRICHASLHGVPVGDLPPARPKRIPKWQAIEQALAARKKTLPAAPIFRFTKKQKPSKKRWRRGKFRHRHTTTVKRGLNFSQMRNWVNRGSSSN